MTRVFQVKYSTKTAKFFFPAITGAATSQSGKYKNP